jgi:TRAP-type C4-dicarboxylate transport system substrate-binding protein
MMDARLLGTLEERGFVAFGIIEGGFAYLMSNKATRDFSDLKGQKAWTPEGDKVGTAILEAAGLAPIPLPISDVLTGLQTGLIDTVAGPPVGAVALQWFTKVKYVTEVPIVYTYGVIALSSKAFGRLPEADQKVVREVFARVSDEMDRGTREDNQGARQALAKQGLEFVQTTPEATQRWYEVAARARQRLVDDDYVSAEMVAEIERIAAEFRESSSQPPR